MPASGPDALRRADGDGARAQVVPELHEAVDERHREEVLVLSSAAAPAVEDDAVVGEGAELEVELDAVDGVRGGEHGHQGGGGGGGVAAREARNLDAATEKSSCWIGNDLSLGFQTKIELSVFYDRYFEPQFAVFS